MFQLKLVNYPLKKLYQELEKADRSFRYLLMIQDEIYKRYSLKNDRTSMTIARHERYEFLKNHFEIVNVLVPANHYQGKDFFESKERIFLEKHIEILCEIKNMFPSHHYSEISHYYRRVLSTNREFVQILKSIRNKLNAKKLDLTVITEISNKFYDLFKHLEYLRKITDASIIADALLENMDKQGMRLLDLIHQMINRGIFNKVLILSGIMHEKEFAILIKKTPLKELVSEYKEIEYLKVIK